MKKVYVCSLIALGLAVSAVAQEKLPKGYTRNPMLARTGGFVQKPGVRQGRILIVNQQSRVSTNEFAALCKSFSKQLHITMAAVNKQPSGASYAQTLSEVDANFGIFLVDKKDVAEPIAIYPENRYAVVNVSRLAPADGAQAFLNARTRKEVVRALLMLTGYSSSRSYDNLMGPIFSAAELDKFTDDAIPVDAVARTFAFLPQAGCETRAIVPYYTAVKEGWAQPPTNSYQQVIWDKYHSLPSNPIKIKPETKKVKE